MAGLNVHNTTIHSECEGFTSRIKKQANEKLGIEYFCYFISAHEELT